MIYRKLDKMEISFVGKKALVTGASQGIGQAIAKKLVECQAEVIAVSKTKAHLDVLKAELPSIKTVCVDLSNWEATEEALKDIGPVDLLVNNAGVSRCQSLGDITADAIDMTFSVNVKAVINVTQIVSGIMKKQGRGGSIVNISSQAGMVALLDHCVYCSTKGALDQLTRCMALELGPYQIRVNSVSPTVVMTEMAKVAWSDPVKVSEMKAKIPLGRFCEPEHVVYPVLYLLSDKADMITGAILPVDGGYTAC
ncbi:L-xylulose reductase-like isoform X3 [Tachypleus tridentatus]|uniref:L-xylulose reductase-like isoform X3 n=1 Tax=Tachypleus tridentatus TaxID=6853 RepID=UPI003FD3B1E6